MIPGVSHVALVTALSAVEVGPVAQAALAESQAGSVDVLSLALESGGVVFAVLALLVGLSVATWGVIGAKATALRRARRDSRAFLVAFREAERLGELFARSASMPDSPIRAAFRAGFQELELLRAEREGRGGRPSGDGPAAAPPSDAAAFDNLERAVAQASATALGELRGGLGFLATIGSAAPFIGLFGTVWGIMQAFSTLDPGRPILETVTPHIAEALVATAVGLLAAIPAVMAYNGLGGRLRGLAGDLDAFAAEYLNLLRRHFF